MTTTDLNRRKPKKVASQPKGGSSRDISTGVRGLDDILGGGIPEYSFNVIAAAPGCGKTTLAHQIVLQMRQRRNPQSISRC